VIDRADVLAVGADDFHVFPDVLRLDVSGHFSFLLF
jgi:hypothetical protein